MKLSEITVAGINPAFALLPPGLDTKKARVMTLAIGMQESAFKYRRQMNNGPAASFWQFEKGGGIRGCINHRASAKHVVNVCMARGVKVSTNDIWTAMLSDDVLGAAMARLLLLTDPRPLPDLDDAQGAWDYYERNWRPGKPHPETWPDYHNIAARFVLFGEDWSAPQ